MGGMVRGSILWSADIGSLCTEDRSLKGGKMYKGKVWPRTGHEGLSLTSALDGGKWLKPRTGHFILGKETQYP